MDQNRALGIKGKSCKTGLVRQLARAAVVAGCDGITVSTMSASSRRFVGGLVSRKCCVINVEPICAVSGVVIAGSMSSLRTAAYRIRLNDVQAPCHHGVGEDGSQLGFVNELAHDVQAGKGSLAGQDVTVRGKYRQQVLPC